LIIKYFCKLIELPKHQPILKKRSRWNYTKRERGHDPWPWWWETRTSVAPKWSSYWKIQNADHDIDRIALYFYVYTI